MKFSRQEYWSRLPFLSPEDFPNPGVEPRSPAFQADSLPSEPPPPMRCECGPSKRNPQGKVECRRAEGSRETQRLSRGSFQSPEGSCIKRNHGFRAGSNQDTEISQVGTSAPGPQTKTKSKKINKSPFRGKTNRSSRACICFLSLQMHYQNFSDLKPHAFKDRKANMIY